MTVTGSSTVDTLALHEARGRLLSRRWFFGDCGIGLAGLAAGARAASAGPAAAPAPAGPRAAE
ncbi:MAG: hypothetical protein ACKOTB_10135, partial [Planctomycetia bacterium]